MYKWQGRGVRRGVTALTVLVGLAMGGSAGAADFTVEGNVKVGTPAAPGDLTVSGAANLQDAHISGNGEIDGSLTLGGPVTMNSTFSVNGGVQAQTLTVTNLQSSPPSCTTANIGQIGMVKTIGVAAIYLCDANFYGGNMTPIMLGFELVSPDKIMQDALAGQTTADKVAGLERQVAALKALVCRDHANEEACR